MADTTAPPGEKRRASSIRAEAEFRARLQELDVTLLEPEWLGALKPHRARCAKGHECAPYPSVLRKGQGPCRQCAVEARMVPRSPETEAAFRRRLAELDAVLLEPEWLGGDKPHRIVCQKGHESRPRPNSVLGGQGVCRICAGNDSDAAEAAFREALALAGATLLEPSWLGANMPHRILCAKGHEASPRPTHVSQGRGVCRVCRGKTWDVFYVVQDAEADVVKFGITSGDPRPRLKDHRLDGFDVVVRLHKALPDEAAHQLERTVQRALAEAGEEPVRGREYFLGRTLPLILDLVDHHSAIRASGAQVPTG